MLSLVYLVSYSLLVIIFVIPNINCDEIENYVNLIKSEIDKSNNYQMPIDNGEYFPENDSEEPVIRDFGRYDFIVVGAGSAGAIIAKRLSENKFKTLLIEAGGNESRFTDIPAMRDFTFFSEYNWGYYTEPQKYACQGMTNKQSPYYRGKSLGGSGTINNLMYVRGNHLDQSFWSDFNITGWTWDDVLPYYKKLERHHNIYSNSNYLGFNGTIPLEYTKPPHPLIEVFLNANKEVYRVTEDYNGKNYMAAGKLLYTTRNGRRASSNKCYLYEKDSNLTILTKAFAYKVIISSKKKAMGIEFIKNKRRYKAICRYEVILSCGVINTPQLLMLSGIGPKKELEKLNIKIIEDLPVGKHFEDHTLFMGIFLETSLRNMNKVKSLEQNIKEYLLGRGTLTKTSDLALAFISTVNNKTYPDVQVQFCAESPPYDPIRHEFNYDSTTQLSFSNFNASNYIFPMIVLLLHPQSTGQVTLNSANPKDFPKINPNSLSNDADLNVIFNSLGYIFKLLESKAFRNSDIKLVKHILPACEIYPYLSKDYWLCQIRHMSVPCLHGIATCRMGTRGNSVVNNELKVHGVQSLRIVDASVIPRSNSGNVNAAVLMVGEKGADIVLNEYKES